jgi:hypothetical protein
MRAARIALTEAVGSSSRSTLRHVARSPITSTSRSIHYGAFQPTTSRLDKGKRREDIKYDTGGVGHSLERQAYFVKSDSGPSEAGADWGSVPEEVVGLEPGRVVECRRCVASMMIWEEADM